MNGRDDEAWLDTLLERRLTSGLSEDGFQQRLLRRLPPRERPRLRAFILGVTGVLAAAALLLPGGDGGALSSTDTGNLVVPFSLGTALLWYLADRWG